jgi:ribosomal protein S18 acetylase RimI-like enzyme
MEAVTGFAQEKKLKVTLSSFKNNQKAVSFYEKLGFKIINHDEFFFDFEWCARSH